MKKHLFLIPFAFLELDASTWELKQGWNLIGGVYNDINVTKLFPNASTVWKYNNGWSAVSPDGSSKSQLNSSGLLDESLEVDAGEGFWVNNSVDENISYNSEYISETTLKTFSYENSDENWSFFYDGACSVEQSSGGKDSEGALYVSNRANNYDGAYIDISSLVDANTTYIIRGYLKRGGANSDTYISNVKIGSSTYKGYNRVLVESDDWTKFRSFARFTKEEIQSGIKFYINSDTYKDDYYLDNIEIAVSKYTSPDTPAGMLKISGDKIVDGDGNKFLLKGINVIGYNDEESTTDDDSAGEFINYSNFDKGDFKNIADMGFNSFRLSLWYRHFEDESNPYVYKEEGFEWLDTVIGWGKENGLYVTLDMHAPQGGGFQGPDNITPFWTGSAYKERFKSLWLEIASRYKNEPAIAAYDLLNEPCPASQSDYITLMEELISGIREIDPNHMINIENTFASDSEPFILSGVENILYDFHMYDPWDGFTDNNSSVYGVDLNSTVMTNIIDGYLEFYSGYPLHVSEFGQKYDNFDSKNSIGWIGDVIDHFNQNSISYQYFSYKGNEFGIYENKNAFYQNSSKNQSLIELFNDKLSEQ